MIYATYFVKPLLGAFIAAALFAPSASALSCLRPDLARTMESVKKSDDNYYILVGTIASTPLPRTKNRAVTSGKTGALNAPARPLNGIGAHTLPGVFKGVILASDPLKDTQAADLPIEIVVNCAGPWCGSAPASDREVIAFVKERADGPLLLEVSACPDNVFYIKPDDGKVEKIRGCFSEECVSSDMRLQGR